MKRKFAVLKAMSASVAGMRQSSRFSKQLNRMKLFNIDLSQFEENADTVNGMSLCHGFVGMMARMRYSNKTEDMKDFCRFFRLAAWNLLRPASFGCSKANLCIPIPLQD